MKASFVLSALFVTLAAAAPGSVLFGRADCGASDTTCSTGDDCCSGYCSTDLKCAAKSSDSCTNTGDACLSGNQCCSGKCSIIASLNKLQCVAA